MIEIDRKWWDNVSKRWDEAPGWDGEKKEKQVVDDSDEFMGVEVVIKHETPKAFKCAIGEVEKWFPKSQIDGAEKHKVGEKTILRVKKWLLRMERRGGQ